MCIRDSTYIDSGAMYRVITWYFLKKHIALSDDVAINNALQQIEISFQQNKICLNGTIMEDEIRKMEISNHVSEVSALAAVRNFAVAQQQLLGQHKGIVMDGRDIGTTVFPVSYTHLDVYKRQRFCISSLPHRQSCCISRQQNKKQHKHNCHYT